MVPLLLPHGVYMRKGDLVKLNKAACFTRENGGNREFSLTHRENDDNQIVDGRRHLTQAEVQEWRESPESKGMNCAGESKLPPTFTFEPIHVDDILIVERARCRASFGWCSPTGGWTKVLKVKTGESLFVKRNLLEKVS